MICRFIIRIFYLIINISIELFIWESRSDILIFSEIYILIIKYFLYLPLYISNEMKKKILRSKELIFIRLNNLLIDYRQIDLYLHLSIISRIIQSLLILLYSLIYFLVIFKFFSFF